MKNKTAIIAGASGLVGGHLLKLLLDSDYERVISVSRRKLNIDHPKLDQQIVNFDELHTLEKTLVGDHVFCCLGSTIRKAGSKEKFLLYDYTYPVELASLTLTNGASQFHLVSSNGANSHSFFFYNRVKGDLQNTISKMDFNSIHIYKPSLLIGEREEFRLGEEAGKFVSYIFYPFFFLYENLKPVKASRVAQAMFDQSIKDEHGVHFHSSKEIQKFK